jgi:hypothetical protein
MLMPATAPPVEEEEETEANKLLFTPLPIGAQLNNNPERYLKCSEHIGRALQWLTAMAPKLKHRQIAT